VRGSWPQSWWSLLLAVPAGIAVYQHVALEGLVVEVEDERFQTVDGVGVSDSIAYAKRRWPGLLLCGRDGFRVAYCAGLAGPRLLLIEGNPIRSIAVSGDLCWPDVSGLTPDARSCAETVRELRQVKG
jgi:hypothetical protein